MAIATFIWTTMTFHLCVLKVQGKLPHMKVPSLSALSGPTADPSRSVWWCSPTTLFLWCCPTTTRQHRGNSSAIRACIRCLHCSGTACNLWSRHQTHCCFLKVTTTAKMPPAMSHALHVSSIAEWIALVPTSGTDYCPGVGSMPCTDWNGGPGQKSGAELVS